MTTPQTLIAFAGDTRIASGDAAHVTRAVRKAAATAHAAVLVFDATTGEQVDLDLRGASEPTPLPRAPAPDNNSVEQARGPGRPKLGVVAREITLLPRHWNWLNSQPGGASVTIRKLVEHALRANAGKDRIRAAQNAAYRFMSAIAGNRKGFEDSARALFASDAATFHRLIDTWPKDIRHQTAKLAAGAFAHEKASA